jgi:STE24 endopeptidase
MILATFYYIATLGLIIKAFLLWTNIKHISKYQDKVPSQFSKMISSTDHKKAALYTNTKLKFKYIILFVNFVILLAWLPFGGMSWLDNYARSFNHSEVSTGLIFFGLYFIVSLILNLPESIYTTFVIEEKFGFNKTTVKTFVIDQLKQIILSIVLMTPLLFGILLFIKKFPVYWWLYSWISIVMFQFVIIWAYPKFISPMFNKFTELKDEELTKDINQLSQKAKIEFKDYFVMNASMRSSHGNAYFTGFGKNKRIVFFDTLLDSLTKGEVVAVLAHELGHLKLKHILKSIVISTISMGIGLYLTSIAFNYSPFFTSFGLKESSYSGLMLFSYLIPLITFFLTPIGSWFSRKNEYEADAFSVRYSSGQELINALVKMYKDNSNTLTPSPIFTKFYNSHPPAIERVAFIESQMLKKKS